MPSKKNKRIAKNTLMLYFRMLFIMGVSLYTSRIVLNVLGVEDFGIYNVVGGLVAMASLINASLSSASQRFITFELGKLANQKLGETFSVVVSIHFVLAILIFIIAETIGVWFLNSYINIAASRMNAANWVFQCSLFSFLIGVISVPYNATIIAHERMKAFAYIGIIEAVLKLIIVFMLVFINFDKLKIYAILVLSISVLIRLIYGYYCKLNFVECKFRMLWNKELFRQIASFAGWQFIGTSSGILMTQGVNILLNIFFGVIINAAQGIAMQVQGTVGGFVNSFMTALNPQITKSYASNDRDYMMRLVLQGARFSFYLMFFLSLPILIETQSVLKFWLKIVPDYAVVFVQLSLVYAISQTFSNTLMTAMQATGNIKTYQIIVGGLQTLNFPFSYITLRLGFPPQSSLIIAIVLSFVCLAARLYLLRNMLNLPVIYYLRHVLLNVSIVAVLSTVVPFMVYSNMQGGILRLFCVCIVCAVSTTVVIYSVGFSKNERIYVHSKISSLRVKYGIM
jgi:O-antigen/teichoic acid export membrane protein